MKYFISRSDFFNICRNNLKSEREMKILEQVQKNAEVQEIELNVRNNIAISIRKKLYTFDEMWKKSGSRIDR